MRKYSIWIRGMYSFLILASVLLAGTVGMHVFEKMSYVDSFYFTTLIVTGEGPASNPATQAGKIFVAFLSIISVGAVVTSIIFLFGPLAGRLIRRGILLTEDEVHRLESIFELKRRTQEESK